MDRPTFLDGQEEDGMPFIASNGVTQAGTSKTIAAGDMTVRYHTSGSSVASRASALLTSNLRKVFLEWQSVA
jgi:hypothetical protein